MDQMMQVIMRLSQEKGVVDYAGSVNTTIRAQRVTKGPMYHPANYAMPEVGTSHWQIPPTVNIISETCPPPSSPTPILSRRVYTYAYMPFLMV